MNSHSEFVNCGSFPYPAGAFVPEEFLRKHAVHGSIPYNPSSNFQNANNFVRFRPQFTTVQQGPLPHQAFVPRLLPEMMPGRETRRYSTRGQVPGSFIAANPERFSVSNPNLATLSQLRPVQRTTKLQRSKARLRYQPVNTSDPHPELRTVESRRVRSTQTQRVSGFDVSVSRLHQSDAPFMMQKLNHQPSALLRSAASFQVANGRKDRRCNPELWNIVSALYHALEHMCQVNQRVMSRKPQAKSCFHSATVPAIPLSDYLMRIAWFSDCSKECFVLALEYIHRLVKCRPEVEVNHNTVHQLIITSIMVATKFLDDKITKNCSYAQVAGLPLASISGFEVQLLFMLNFNLYVSPEQYQSSYKAMLADNDGLGKVTISPGPILKKIVRGSFNTNTLSHVTYNEGLSYSGSAGVKGNRKELGAVVKPTRVESKIPEMFFCTNQPIIRNQIPKFLTVMA